MRTYANKSGKLLQDCRYYFRSALIRSLLMNRKEIKADILILRNALVFITSHESTFIYKSCRPCDDFARIFIVC